MSLSKSFDPGKPQAAAANTPSDAAQDWSWSILSEEDRWRAQEEHKALASERNSTLSRDIKIPVIKEKLRRKPRT